MSFFLDAMTCRVRKAHKSRVNPTSVTQTSRGANEILKRHLEHKQAKRNKVEMQRQCVDIQNSINFSRACNSILLWKRKLDY
jgi:hypothetical protein